MSSAAFRAARELWAVRQLVGFGFKMPVRTFLGLSNFLSVVLVLAAFALGHAWVGLGALLVENTDTITSTHVRAAAALSVVAMVIAGYVAIMDVLRGSLSALRYRVSASSLQGLWAALDITRGTATLVERGVPILTRSTALGAFVGGGSLRLAQLNSSQAVNAAWVAAALALTHGCLALGLALVHARSSGGRRQLPAWLAWLVVFPALILGVLLAWLGGPLMESANSSIDERVRRWAATFDGEGVIAVAAVGITFVLILAIAVLTVGVVAVDRSVDHGTRAEVHRAKSDSLLSVIEVGSGVGRRDGLALRVATLVVSPAAAALGWRLAGGDILPGTEHSGRILAVAAAFASAVVAGTVVGVAGQNALFGQLRHLWESGAGSGRVYLATVMVGVRRVLPLSAAFGLLGWAAWGVVSWKAMLVPVAVLLGEYLVDSIFSQPPDNDDLHRSADPVATTASIVLLLVVLIAASWEGVLALATFVLLTLALGGASRCTFSSRLRRRGIAPA